MGRPGRYKAGMTFEEHFARETFESERMRMKVLALIFAGLAVAFPFFGWVFREEYRSFFPSYVPLVHAMALCGVMVAYWLLVRQLIARVVACGSTPPRAMRFVNALIETSVPSWLMLAALQNAGDPVVVLQGPPVLLYGIFIILSTLRLDFALPVFTGAVAAAEFGALSLAYLPGAPCAGILGAHSFILMKCLMLVLAGVAAGFVAGQLRRRIRKALHTAEERQRIISAFGQQVPPAVVDEIVRGGGELPSRRSFVCIMFMDIRDFTRHVEHRTPEEIVALQNKVFGTAIEVVSRHHGVINQFMGDGFMATFGAPVSTGDDCRNAVAAARELVACVEGLRIGIGLHAGDVVTGNVGSEVRKQYSITGNTVILASRIEQLNKTYDSQVLLSREVLERCGDEARGAEPLGAVHVKGREQPVEIYRFA
jgi:adenylate cyclase